MMKGFMEEKQRYDAVFQLIKKDYPELKNASLVITDDGDKVYIAVKALVPVFYKQDDHVFAKQEQVGDYCIVSKSATIAMFFDAIKERLESVSALAEEVKNGVKA